MHRDSILHLLDTYSTTDIPEKLMVSETINFVKANTECFSRQLLAGHLTGSGWIVNKERTHALLIHHFKIDKWFQPGGHCDGCPDVLSVAIKESIEETTLQVTPVFNSIFDVDIHTISARAGVPEHLHYDIRFLLESDRNSHIFNLNREVKAIEWVKLETITHYNNSPSIIRMVNKTLNLKQ